MGAQARLYTSSGTLKYSSSMVYNDSPVINIYAYSSRTTSSGYFYAQSKVSFYNGNGYTSYTANKSPNASVASTFGSNIGYSVNENNETYGSGLLAETIGIEPDLIAAVGIDGTEGYVRSEDISPTPSTPQEAVAIASLAKTDRCIPLYNLDGEVIGEFIVNAVEDAEVNSIKAFYGNWLNNLKKKDILSVNRIAVLIKWTSVFHSFFFYKKRIANVRVYQLISSGRFFF